MTTPRGTSRPIDMLERNCLVSMLMELCATWGATMETWIKAAGLSVVLVVSCGLGTLGVSRLPRPGRPATAARGADD
jgi:hypothetical protein